MTVLEAFTRYQELYVEEGTDSYLTEVSFVDAYDISRRAWLRAMAVLPETEKVKRLTSVFNAPTFIAFRNLLDGIKLSDIASDICVVRAVLCDFDVKKGGVSIGSIYNRPCSPVRDDSFGTDYDDPARRGDDMYPRYREETGNDNQLRLVFYCDTYPIKAQVRYWKYLPAPVLTSSNPGFLPESDDAIDEILLRVLSRQDMTITDSARYQINKTAEQPMLEQQ